jgi:hypothetical protein
MELEPGARIAIAEALAFRVGQVTAPAPPVKIIAPAFLSAVLAERRRRELARLATTRATYSTNPYAAPTGPFAAPNPYAVAAGPPNPYAVPAGPFAPPSPYGAQPPPYAPPPPPARTPAPAPETTKVNAEGWHAPGSEPDQWS